MKILRRNQTNRRRFARTLDILEPRLTLAGVVTAMMSSEGDLLITGDDQSNQVGVAFAQDEFGNDSVVVSSLDETTLINGSTDSVYFGVDSLVGELHVDLMGGDDVFRLGAESHDSTATTEADEGDDHEGGAIVPGGIYISMGSGSDSVRVTSVETFGDLVIMTTDDGAMDNDNDFVNIGRGPGFEEEGHEEELLASILAAATEAEDDACGDEGPRADVIVGGDVRIMTGDGDDSVRVAFASIDGSLRVQTGAGSDLVVTGRGPIAGRHGSGGGDGCGGGGGGGGGHDAAAAAAPAEGGDSGRPVDTRVGEDVDIDTGPGDDFVMLRNIGVQGPLNVSMSSGNDALGAQNLVAADTATLRTGPGDDTVALWQSDFIGKASLDTGPGQDKALLDNVYAADDFTADMSSHDDTLMIVNSMFDEAPRLNGGSGQYDTLGIRNSSMPASSLFDSSPNNGRWENVIPSSSTLIDDVIETAKDLFGPYKQGK